MFPESLEKSKFLALNILVYSQAHKYCFQADTNGRAKRHFDRFANAFEFCGY